MSKDVCDNGIIDPIMLYQGKILDGRNRYDLACKQGLRFKSVDFTGNDAEALKYVITELLQTMF